MDKIITTIKYGFFFRDGKPWFASTQRHAMLMHEDCRVETLDFNLAHTVDGFGDLADLWEKLDNPACTVNRYQSVLDDNTIGIMFRFESR